jgi:putative phosphoesterase
MTAIIADIHGNLPALKAALDSITRAGCREIISIGDVAGYYCMVNECIALLRERNIPHLMGNHDSYLIEGTPCPRSTAANKCLDYQRTIITSENMAWLAESKTMIKISGASLVHGGWNNHLDEYMEEIAEEYFAGLEGRIFISGHTHVQVLRQLSDKTYCNPGSVGQPRDGDPRAAFAILQDGKFTLNRVEYDIDGIASEVRARGFSAYFYENLYKGTRIGGAISKVSIG